MCINVYTKSGCFPNTTEKSRQNETPQFQNFVVCVIISSLPIGIFDSTCSKTLSRTTIRRSNRNIQRMWIFVWRSSVTDLVSFHVQISEKFLQSRLRLRKLLRKYNKKTVVQVLHRLYRGGA